VKKPIIVLTGGGSGGHITPILAVAAEIKNKQPDCKLIYIGQTGDPLGDLPSKDVNIDKTYTVRAGKYRRYHGQRVKQFFDIKTLILNTRDIFYILAGLFQSYFLIRKLRPDVIFSRGGYVSVPVCIGGKLNNVSYITHDSDSIPSLANRLIARWATWHAVALPANIYPYPKAKTITVGVPINQEYKTVSAEQKLSFMSEIGVPKNSQILLVTGGGNGAENLNSSIVNCSHELLSKYPSLYIVHFAGRSLLDSVKNDYQAVLSPDQFKRIKVFGYATDHYKYSGAADLIVARGGATSLAEIAAQAKPCIVIPSPQLIWNVKNAQTLEKMHSAILLQEKNLKHGSLLAEKVSELLNDQSLQKELSKNIHSLSKPQAANDLANLIIKSTN
jgi:UDP-N-acetylglucosamine--N-acetylmuramyl-(pentapeptide) pyrophosphoryl-undecaprenol N-acetylglucosamine transferase